MIILTITFLSLDNNFISEKKNMSRSPSFCAKLGESSLAKSCSRWKFNNGNANGMALTSKRAYLT